MNLEHKKIQIHTLTPLFIGNGQDFSPLTFWMNCENNELVEFSEDALIDKLLPEDKNKLGRLDLLNFMRLIFNTRPTGKSIPVCSDIVETYKKVLTGEQKEFNKFAIKKLISNPNSNLPYIPGSSLKGALRTAYLAACNGLTKKKENKVWEINEDAVLGRMNTDIFSALKVGDANPLGEVKTQIFYAQRCPKKTTGKSAPSTMLHTVMGGGVFSGEITLLQSLNIKTGLISITDILEKMGKYSNSLLQDEKIGIKYPSLAELQQLKAEFANPVYLCRLGGFIGAESHTIDGFRDIKIRNPKKNNDFRPYTTQSICASMDKRKNTNISFGWCFIEVLEGPASQNLPHLRNFVQEQEQQLLGNFSYRSRRSVYSNYPAGVLLPQTSFDRNGVYSAKVARLSKKGKAIVQVDGKEFTLLDEGLLEIGQTIKVAQIQGTTCKLKK